MARIQVLIVLSASAFSAFAFGPDIISDITSPVADERRALEIKSEEFWQLIKQVAQETKLGEHLAVYDDAEAALAAMPAENEHVHALLAEALVHLRRADGKVLEQAVQSSELAAVKLATGPVPESALSFLTGGQNFLSSAIRRFVGGGGYENRAAADVTGRQADILPTLRGAAEISGNVLSDCRMASKLSFDLLKYDIYNKGVAKTPEAAKAAAYRVVDAAGQTRHHFMQGIVGMANAIAKDTQEKDVAPSAKVTQSLLSSLEPFGSKVEGASSVRGSSEGAIFIDL